METEENTSKANKTSGLNKAVHVAHEVIDGATEATYEVANKIVDTGDEFSDVAHETVDRATTSAQQALDKLSEKKDQLRNAEQQLLANYSSYVRQNPITSVSIAMAVGFLLSKLLNNR